MRHVFGFDRRIEIDRNPDPPFSLPRLPSPDPDFVRTLPPRSDGFHRPWQPRPFPLPPSTTSPFRLLPYRPPPERWGPPAERPVFAGLEAWLLLLDQSVDGLARAPTLPADSVRHLRNALADQAQKTDGALPPEGRAVFASVLPVLAAVDAGLALQEREAADRATAAEGARAFAQLERLTQQGLPLAQALASAEELFAALGAGGLLGALPDAAKDLARERLAAAKLRARLASDPAASLAAAPEAALLSAATLDELEQERQALQAERAAAGQAALLAGLAAGKSALSEEQVLQVLGPALGAKAWQTYQRHQGEAAAAAGFAAVERVAPGLARLLQRPETEAFARRLAVLLQEGSAAPTPWTPAEAKQRAEAWIGIESAHPGDDAASRAQRGNAIVRFLEAHVAALPQDLQEIALAALENQGAGAATPGALAAVAAALREGRLVAAVELAKGVADGVGGGGQESVNSLRRQFADSGQIADDTAGSAAPSNPSARIGGLPSAEAPLGAWDQPTYAPERQQEILSLLSQLEGTTDLGSLNARIDEVFADDPAFAARLKALVEQSRTITADTASPDDALAGSADREQARSELTAMRRRVEQGKHYDAGWASLHDALTGLEGGTGYRFRPYGAGLVAIYAAEGDEPLTLLTQGAVAALAEAEQDALKSRLSYLERALRGELTDSERAPLHALFSGQDPVSAAEEAFVGASVDADTSFVDALYDANQAIRNGADGAEVGSALGIVVLAPFLENAHFLSELALDILPVIGEYRSLESAVENFGDLVSALEDGDLEAAIDAGLLTVLDLAGAVPLVGGIARTIGHGLFRLFGEAADVQATTLLKRLAHAPLSREYVASGTILDEAPDLKTLVNGFKDRPSTMKNEDFVLELLNAREFNHLKPAQKQALAAAFGQGVIPKVGEQLFAKAFPLFGGKAGLKVAEQLRVSLVGSRVTIPDFSIGGETFDIERAKQWAKEAVPRLDFEDFMLVEIKTGTTVLSEEGLRDGQKELFEILKEAGLEQHFIVLNVRQDLLPSRMIRDAALAGFDKLDLAQKGITKSDVEALAAAFQAELPLAVPAWLPVVLTMAVIARAGGTVLDGKHQPGSSSIFQSAGE